VIKYLNKSVNHCSSQKLIIKIYISFPVTPVVIYTHPLLRAHAITLFGNSTTVIRVPIPVILICAGRHKIEIIKSLQTLNAYQFVQSSICIHQQF